jgi:hypothetical protein
MYKIYITYLSIFLCFVNLSLVFHIYFLGYLYVSFKEWATAASSRAAFPYNLTFTKVGQLDMYLFYSLAVELKQNATVLNTNVVRQLLLATAKS